ncbi:MAG: beta-ketoacyl-[acyl-carrier-protein] synthase family protein [Firmicutes bacterium]|nr:beta-ketoacyl-[acyl-carrier-protein] synthase family protein [Bacillota bacterium]
MRVAITGMGCLCAAGGTLPQCMATLFRGHRAPALPRRFSTSHSDPYPVFEVPDFEESPDLLRTSAMGLAAAREALKDAGLDEDALKGLRVGVCVGTTMGSTLNDESFCRAFRRGETPDLEPMARIRRSNPAEVIARTFGFRGPCQTIVNACSSGTDALGIGADWIEAGLCDVVIAGGADELGRVTYSGFISMKIADNTPCKPFDLNRKGLNLGEGAAMLVLQSETSRRGRARGYLEGYGSACDAYHQTAPHPEGLGLKRALRQALGSVPVEDVAFVNVHGTGTPDNDKVEGRVLSELMPAVPFLSTKGYTGHTLGAAGAIEAAFTVACLEEGRIPPSVGFDTPDPDVGICPVADITPIRSHRALSQSLAFGGNNAVVLLAKGERP